MRAYLRIIPISIYQKIIIAQHCSSILLVRLTFKPLELGDSDCKPIAMGYILYFLTFLSLVLATGKRSLLAQPRLHMLTASRDKLSMPLAVAGSLSCQYLTTFITAYLHPFRMTLNLASLLAILTLPRTLRPETLAPGLISKERSKCKKS